MTIFNVAKVLPLHTGYDERPRELCFYLIAVQCVLGRTWGNRDGIRLAAGVSLAVQLLSIPAGRHHYSRPIITMTNKHDIYPIGLSSRHIVLFGWNASRHYHETDFFSFFCLTVIYFSSPSAFVFSCGGFRDVDGFLQSSTQVDCSLLYDFPNVFDPVLLILNTWSLVHNR